MPSPTSSTLPVSWDWTPVFTPTISCSITETISPTLNVMAAPLDEVVLNGLQPGAHAGVVDPIAHPHHEPTQQARIDGLLEDRLAPRDRLQVVIQFPPFLVGERHGGAHQGAEPMAAPLVQRLVRRGDGAKRVEPAAVVEHHQELDEHLAGAAIECLVDDLVLALAADGRAVEEQFQARALLEDAVDQRLELLEDLGLLVDAGGGLVEGLGVDAANMARLVVEDGR